MAIVLALITSGLYGTSDFFGGMATMREPVVRVMLWVHLIGLVAVTAVAPILAERVIVGDLFIGAIAGLVGLGGLLLLYWALSAGPMSVVAPVSGVMMALVPVLWGLQFGDEGLSAVGAAGIAVGLAAVITTSWRGTSDGPESPHSTAPITPLLVGVSLLAGSCFGTLLLLYDATEDDGAPWPVVSGRVVTTGLLLAFSATRKLPLSPGSATGFVVVAGIGDTFANVTMLLAAGAAVGSRELAAVAVLVAFYPAATVLWARLALGERLGPVRSAGLVLAAAAVVLMTLA